MPSSVGMVPARRVLCRSMVTKLSSRSMPTSLGREPLIDVLLNTPGVDFEGGVLMTREADGTDAAHPLEKGDAAVFVSHKPHFVSPVTAGERRVLVIELWEGSERPCNHRCQVREGSRCDEES